MTLVPAEIESVTSVRSGVPLNGTTEVGDGRLMSSAYTLDASSTNCIVHDHAEVLRSGRIVGPGLLVLDSTEWLCAASAAIDQL